MTVLADPAQSTLRSRRLGNRLLGAAALIVGGAMVFAGLDAFHRNHALMINASDSLPNWAFYMTRTTDVKRGDYVSFVPPRHPLVISHFGAKPPMFAKIIYGMPGDIVTHVGGQVSINGKFVGKTKRLSKRGESLAQGPTGIIPQGCYYAGTPSKDGFDSRYAAIGFVCSTQIFGTGVPIL
jgi:conjugal transfer pilin signal peptidase TrbI